MTPLREKILRCIKPGTSARPVTVASIAQQVGASPEVIRKTVYTMRRDGERICGKTGPHGGYWLPPRRYYLAVQLEGADMRLVPL